jgi:hypothetical protein
VSLQPGNPHTPDPTCSIEPAHHGPQTPSYPFNLVPFANFQCATDSAPIHTR